MEVERRFFSLPSSVKISNLFSVVSQLIQRQDPKKERKQAIEEQKN